MIADARRPRGATLSSERFAEAVFGRSDGGAFSEDLQRAGTLVSDRISDRRVLIVGGAGTIGSATLRALLTFRPKSVHVFDPDENGLAELVRNIRSRSWTSPLPELSFTPIEYGVPLVRQLLRSSDGFDVVMNFAAMKHVRSEKSAVSLIRMFDVNVLSLMRFLRWMGEDLPAYPGHVFSVSTDKAADPVSLMGASKRLMEAVLVAGPGGESGTTRTSARFANVAFSAGSLLDGWVRRVRLGQPLACPRDTSRFFITPTEAGRLCLLAALVPSDGLVAIPSDEAGVQEWDLESVAGRFLALSGFRTIFVGSEEEARRDYDRHLAAGRYPVVRTTRDTSGEKRSESFVGKEEAVVPLDLQHLSAVRPAHISSSDLLSFERHLEPLTTTHVPSAKGEVVSVVSRVVPMLEHLETGRTLDDRM